jgi:hypothetical protein
MPDETYPHIVVEWTQQDESFTNTKMTYYGPFDGYEAANDWCAVKMERNDRYFIIPLIKVGRSVPEVTLCPECEEKIMLVMPGKWWKEAGTATEEEKQTLRAGDVLCNECDKSEV